MTEKEIQESSCLLAGDCLAGGIQNEVVKNDCSCPATF